MTIERPVFPPSVLTMRRTSIISFTNAFQGPGCIYGFRELEMGGEALERVFGIAQTLAYRMRGVRRNGIEKV